MKEEFSFDKSLAEITEILARLQRITTSSVDQMVEDINRGMALCKECTEKLRDYEERLGPLFGDEHDEFGDELSEEAE